MKRRGFLKIFGQATAVVVAAPVLAKLPEKTYPWPESRSLRPGIQKLYNESYAESLAKAMQKTKEQVAADVYTRAFK